MTVLLGRNRQRFERIDVRLQTLFPMVEQFILGPARVADQPALLEQGLSDEVFFTRLNESGLTRVQPPRDIEDLEPWTSSASPCPFRV